jgi:hypothetical protein
MPGHEDKISTFSIAEDWNAWRFTSITHTPSCRAEAQHSLICTPGNFNTAFFSVMV